MKEQLVSFKTAKIAKEKGFNEECMSYYKANNRHTKGHLIDISYEDDYIEFTRNTYGKTIYTAPTQSLLQKWLREEHGLIIQVNLFDIPEGNYSWEIKHFDPSSKWKIVVKASAHSSHREGDLIWVEKYEQALESALQKALELI